MLVTCPTCLGRFEYGPLRCPHCGESLLQPESPRPAGPPTTPALPTRAFRWGFALVAVVAVFSLAVIFSARLVPTRTARPLSPPSAAPAPEPLVQKQVPVEVYCAYCGQKVGTKTRTVEVPASQVPPPVRADGVCTNPTCRRAAALHANHPDWDRRICSAIVQKQVRIGMDRDQARASWGQPANISTTITPAGTHEQWSYGKVGRSSLFFEGGVVKSIRD